jgi:protein-disulfide isomerase
VVLGLAGLASAVAAYVVVSFVQVARQQNGIAEHAEEIFRSPATFVAGNPDGDVSVVAFFDYNCPYCRQGAPALAKLIANDGKVRLVLKELPVLEGAITANKALADALGVHGVPFYMVGDRPVPDDGDSLYDALVARVADVRTTGCRIKC